MNKLPRYYFTWDPAKETENLRKHRVAFRSAMSVLVDPLAITLHDKEHSELEQRWSTIGRTEEGLLLVVIHTLETHGEHEGAVRLISARKATAWERRQYEDNPYFIHEDRPMKDEYDFSGGERGKFYRKGAILIAPIYIEPDVLAFFEVRAREQETSVDELLNAALRTEIKRLNAEGR